MKKQNKMKKRTKNLIKTSKMKKIMNRKINRQNKKQIYEKNNE